MKSLGNFLFYLSIVVFISSCGKPSDMLTVINADGSCYREFTSSGDLDFLKGDTATKLNPFPVTIDSTWTVCWKYKESAFRTDFPISQAVYDSISKIEVSELSDKNGNMSVDNLIVVARQNYTSVDDMANRFKLKSSNEWSRRKPQYSFEKKFRWFYTYFTYSEIYPKIDLRIEIPINKYLSKDEAQFWFTGKSELLKGMNGIEIREFVGAIEEKYNNWFAQNRWNAGFKVLLANYDKINNAPITKQRLEILKDSIFESKVKGNQDFKMAVILNDYFKTTAFSVFWNAADSPMKEFEDKFNNEFVENFMSAFNYKLVMPGNVVEANDAVIQGDTLIWRLTSYRLIQDNYKIEAKSRVTNIWAFILSALVLVVAVGSFVWKPKRGV